MYRGSGPRILPIIIVIIVVALVIAALVAVGRMIFSGNRSTTDNDQGTSESALFDAVVDQADTRAVRWTVRGPIVADEEFRSYQISVSPSQREYVLYSGYLDQVLDRKTYGNNSKAYEQFVYALDKANISKTRAGASDDLRGICATNGLAYKFETLSSGAPDHSLWSSTCKDSKGTLASDVSKIQALFVNQIPDFQPVFNKIY